MKKSSYQERNTIARELYETFARDLAEVSFRVDETIGRNSTNPSTRESLRAIRSSLSSLIAKSAHLREEKFELSHREREVLQLVSQGLTSPEIAEKLFLSLPTIKSHLASSYRKLGVANRVEALSAAQKLGLLAKQ